MKKRLSRRGEEMTRENPGKFKNKETDELADVYFVGLWMVNFVNRPARDGYVEQEMISEEDFEKLYEEVK